MTDLRGLRVVVVGAGVFGLSVAALSAGEGADVLVCDDRAIGDNASGVAAGMLAPAFEALDEDQSGRFALYRRARDLWPGFLEQIEAAPRLLERSGAMQVFRADTADHGNGVLRRLADTGARAQSLDAAQVRELQPLLDEEICSAVFTPDDWRLNPGAVLAAMRTSLLRQGGRFRGARAEPGPGGVMLAGERLKADVVVIAAGAAWSAWAGAAPELSVLSPIKGQIVHYDAAPPLDGPIVRIGGGYVVPQARGAAAGATMEFGRADAEVDPAMVESLARQAAACFPHLRDAPRRGQAGVRAATPDGLPLVGRSRSGLWLAAGARRNGWLLAPMAAQIVVAGLKGQTPDARSMFHAGRFAAPSSGENQAKEA